MRAFILAAGYGERLRPITDHIPKPLLPILGMPVLELVLERLDRLPLESIGINLHYKTEMLIEWLDASMYSGKVERFHEAEILGTGGGLKNAAAFLANSLFIVHNSDIIADIDLSLLIEEHLSRGATVTLAVHNNEKFNNVLIDQKGDLAGVGSLKADDPRLCKISFTGIAVYSPDFLQFLPEGNSSVIDAWLRALKAGRKIGTVDYSGCSWTDIGTPEAYSSAVFNSLRQSGEMLYVHSSSLCGSTDIRGLAAIERDCETGAGTCLSNCILLPETHIPDGSRIEDAIVGPGYMIRLAIKEVAGVAFSPGQAVRDFFQGPSEDLECRPVGNGGSDRQYYRLAGQGKTAVLMVCSGDDPDFQRQIEYTDFFRRHSLPVPEMFIADTKNREVLFEDLGDFSLYSWLKCHRSPGRIEKVYRKVLDILMDMHVNVSRNIGDCPLLASRVFDYDHFRWETGYFLERFVQDLIGVAINGGRQLKDEFHKLAEIASLFPKTIVHRDFQSQNIMITEGEIPRLIDYQGARIGPPAYDLASILWDPYYRLGDDLRQGLLDYYIAGLRSAAASFDEDQFSNSLILCRLQRHMQALGAYGYLSVAKGKKHFLRHVPQAMSYLTEEAATVGADFPGLLNLVTELDTACRRKFEYDTAGD